MSVFLADISATQISQQTSDLVDVLQSNPYLSSQTITSDHHTNLKKAALLALENSFKSNLSSNAQNATSAFPQSSIGLDQSLIDEAIDVQSHEDLLALSLQQESKMMDLTINDNQLGCFSKNKQVIFSNLDGNDAELQNVQQNLSQTTSQQVQIMMEKLKMYQSLVATQGSEGAEGWENVPKPDTSAANRDTSNKRDTIDDDDFNMPPIEGLDDDLPPLLDGNMNKMAATYSAFSASKGVGGIFDEDEDMPPLDDLTEPAAKSPPCDSDSDDGPPDLEDNTAPVKTPAKSIQKSIDWLSDLSYNSTPPVDIIGDDSDGRSADSSGETKGGKSDEPTPPKSLQMRLVSATTTSKSPFSVRHVSHIWDFSYNKMPDGVGLTGSINTTSPFFKNYTSELVKLLETEAAQNIQTTDALTSASPSASPSATTTSSISIQTQATEYNQTIKGSFHFNDNGRSYFYPQPGVGLQLRGLNFVSNQYSSCGYTISVDMYVEQYPPTSACIMTTDSTVDSALAIIMDKNGYLIANGHNDISHQKVPLNQWVSVALCTFLNPRGQRKAINVFLNNSTVLTVALHKTGQLIEPKGKMMTLFSQKKSDSSNRAFRISRAWFSPTTLNPWDYQGTMTHLTGSNSGSTLYSHAVAKRDFKVFQNLSLSALYNKPYPVWAYPIVSQGLWAQIYTDGAPTYFETADLLLLAFILKQTSYSQTTTLPAVLDYSFELNTNAGTSGEFVETKQTGKQLIAVSEPFNDTPYQSVDLAKSTLLFAQKVFTDTAFLIKMHPMTTNATSYTSFIKALITRLLAFTASSQHFSHAGAVSAGGQLASASGTVDAVCVPLVYKFLVPIARPAEDPEEITLPFTMIIEPESRDDIEMVDATASRANAANTVTTCRVTIVNTYYEYGVKFHPQSTHDQAATLSYKPCVTVEKVSFAHLTSEATWHVFLESLFNSHEAQNSVRGSSRTHFQDDANNGDKVKVIGAQALRIDDLYYRFLPLILNRSWADVLEAASRRDILFAKGIIPHLTFETVQNGRDMSGIANFSLHQLNTIDLTTATNSGDKNSQNGENLTNMVGNKYKNFQQSRQVYSRFADCTYIPVQGLGNSELTLVQSMEYLFRRFSGFSAANSAMLLNSLRLHVLDMTYNDLQYHTQVNSHSYFTILYAIRAVAQSTISQFYTNRLDSIHYSNYQSWIIARGLKRILGSLTTQISKPGALAGKGKQDDTKDTSSLLQSSLHTTHPQKFSLLDDGITFYSQHNLFPMFDGLIRTRSDDAIMLDDKTNSAPIDLLDFPTHITSYSDLLYCLRRLNTVAMIVQAQSTLVSNSQFIISSLLMQIIPRLPIPVPYTLQFTSDASLSSLSKKSAKGSSSSSSSNNNNNNDDDFGDSDNDNDSSNDITACAPLDFYTTEHLTVAEQEAICQELRKLSVMLIFYMAQNFTIDRESTHTYTDLAPWTLFNRNVIPGVKNNYILQLFAGSVVTILDRVFHKMTIDASSHQTLLYNAVLTGEYGFHLDSFKTATDSCMFYDPTHTAIRTQILWYFDAVKYSKPVFGIDDLKLTSNTMNLHIDLCNALGVQPTDTTELNDFAQSDFSKIHCVLPVIRHFSVTHGLCQVLVRNPICLLQPIVSSNMNPWLTTMLDLDHNHLDFTFVCETQPALRSLNMSSLSLPKSISFSSAHYVINQFLRQRYRQDKHAKEFGEDGEGGDKPAQNNDSLDPENNISIDQSENGTDLGYVEKKIENEEDLMSLDTLPTFGDMLSQLESELLLSYLLVPYLRIPLLLQFFAQNGRVRALNNGLLRQLLDNSIFEQGNVVFPQTSDSISIADAMQLSNSLSGGLGGSVVSNSELVAAESSKTMSKLSKSTRALFEKSKKQQQRLMAGKKQARLTASRPTTVTDVLSNAGDMVNQNSIISALTPTEVPQPSNSPLIGTPSSLLLNELLQNPAIIVDSCIKMYHDAMELDIGTAGNTNMPVILYSIRLSCQILKQLNWLVEYGRGKVKEITLHFVDISQTQIDRLEVEQKKLATVLVEDALEKCKSYAFEVFCKKHYTFRTQQFAHHQAKQILDGLVGDSDDVSAETGGTIGIGSALESGTISTADAAIDKLDSLNTDETKGSDGEDSTTSSTQIASTIQDAVKSMKSQSAKDQKARSEWEKQLTSHNDKPKGSQRDFEFTKKSLNEGQQFFLRYADANNGSDQQMIGNVQACGTVSHNEATTRSDYSINDSAQEFTMHTFSLPGGGKGGEKGDNNKILKSVGFFTSDKDGSSDKKAQSVLGGTDSKEIKAFAITHTADHMAKYISIYSFYAHILLIRHVTTSLHVLHMNEFNPTQSVLDKLHQKTKLYPLTPSISIEILSCIMFLTSHYSFDETVPFSNDYLYSIFGVERKRNLALLLKLKQGQFNLFLDCIIQSSTCAIPIDFLGAISYLQKQGLDVQLPPDHILFQIRDTYILLKTALTHPESFTTPHPTTLPQNVLIPSQSTSSASDGDDKVTPLPDPTTHLAIDLNKLITIRHWGYSPGQLNRGKFRSAQTLTFKPQNVLTYLLSSPKDLYLPSTKLPECELDLNLYQIPLGNQKMTAIPPDIVRHSMFRDYFRNQQLQAMLIDQNPLITTYSVLGTGYTLQYFNNERISQKPAVNPFFSREYDPQDVYPHEQWIVPLFEPYRLRYLNNPAIPYVFYLQNINTNTSSQIQDDSCDGKKSRSNKGFCPYPTIRMIICIKTDTLRPVYEAIFYQHHYMFQLFSYTYWNLKYYLTFSYASNSELSYSSVDQPTNDRISFWEPWERKQTQPNHVYWGNQCLVIKRAATQAGNVSLSSETLLPHSLLTGLIPAAIVGFYDFWQDEWDNIRGYPKPDAFEDSTHASDDGQSAENQAMNHILFIQLVSLDKTDSTLQPGTVARVMRVPMTLVQQQLAHYSANLEVYTHHVNFGTSQQQQSGRSKTPADLQQLDDLPPLPTLPQFTLPETDEELDSSGVVLEIINLLNTPNLSASRQVATVLTQMEPLSTILAWKRLVAVDPDDPTVYTKYIPLLFPQFHPHFIFDLSVAESQITSTLSQTEKRLICVPSFDGNDSIITSLNNATIIPHKRVVDDVYKLGTDGIALPNGHRKLYQPITNQTLLQEYCVRCEVDFDHIDSISARKLVKMVPPGADPEDSSLKREIINLQLGTQNIFDLIELHASRLRFTCRACPVSHAIHHAVRDEKKKMSKHPKDWTRDDHEYEDKLENHYNDHPIEYRLYSLDYNDLFIASLADFDETKRQQFNTYIQPLLQTIPYYLVMESSVGRLSILVPNHKPIRPVVIRAPYHTEILPQVIDTEWLETTGIYHYHYDVHLSSTHLIPQTPTAALYLLLLKMLKRDYASVPAILKYIPMDTAFTPGENLIVQALSQCKKTDYSIPDCIAAMLQIALVIYDKWYNSTQLTASNLSGSETRLQFPWPIGMVILHYSGFNLANFVNAKLRLTPNQEHAFLQWLYDKTVVQQMFQLLPKFNMDWASTFLLGYNRYNTLTAILSNLPSRQSITITPFARHKPTFDDIALPDIAHFVKWYYSQTTIAKSLVPGYTVTYSTPTDPKSPTTSTFQAQNVLHTVQIDQTDAAPLHVQSSLPQTSQFRLDLSAIAQQFRFLTNLNTNNIPYIVNIFRINESLLSDSGFGFLLVYSLLTDDLQVRGLGSSQSSQSTNDGVEQSASFMLGLSFAKLMKDFAQTHNPLNFIIRLIISQPILRFAMPKLSHYKSLATLRQDFKTNANFELGEFVFMIARTIVKLYLSDPSAASLGFKLKQSRYAEGIVKSKQRQKEQKVDQRNRKKLQQLVASEAGIDFDTSASTSNHTNFADRFITVPMVDVPERQFVSKKLTDTDCSQRYIVLSQRGGHVATNAQTSTVLASEDNLEFEKFTRRVFSPTHLQPLVDKILSPLGLGEIIQKTLKQTLLNLQPSDESTNVAQDYNIVPDDILFNVQHHPHAGSSIARQMLTRLQQDAKFLASQQSLSSNYQSTLTILQNLFTLQPTQTSTSAPSASQLNHLILDIYELKQQLLSLKSHDSKVVYQGQMNLEQLANSISLPPQLNLLNPYYVQKNTLFSTSEGQKAAFDFMNIVEIKRDIKLLIENGVNISQAEVSEYLAFISTLKTGSHSHSSPTVQKVAKLLHIARIAFPPQVTTQSLDEYEVKQRLSHVLGQIGAFEHDMHLDYITSTLTSSHAIVDLLKCNPYIQEKYLFDIPRLIEVIFLGTTRIALSNRILLVLDELILSTSRYLNYLYDHNCLGEVAMTTQSSTTLLQTSPNLADQNQINSMLTTIQQQNNALCGLLSTGRQYFTVVTDDDTKSSPLTSSSPILSKADLFDDYSTAVETDKTLMKAWKQQDYKKRADLSKTLFANSGVLRLLAIQQLQVVLDRHNEQQRAQMIRTHGAGAEIDSNNVILDHPLKANCPLLQRLKYKLRLIEDACKKQLNKFIGLYDIDQIRSQLVADFHKSSFQPGRLDSKSNTHGGFLDSSDPTQTQNLGESDQDSLQIKSTIASTGGTLLNKENLDSFDIQQALSDSFRKTPQFVEPLVKHTKQGRFGFSKYTLALIRFPTGSSRASNDITVLAYDPRFLVFEYVRNLCIRAKQINMLLDLAKCIEMQHSKVRQMQMGEGKSSLISPLLQLLSTSKQNPRLLLQVVPTSLLPSTYTIMKTTFSNLIHKEVFSFIFERTSPIRVDLFKALESALENQDVVITTPTSIKSMLLKFIELQQAILEYLHIPSVVQLEGRKLTEPKSRATDPHDNSSSYSASKRQAMVGDLNQLNQLQDELSTVIDILKLFKKHGVLIVDEVGEVLNPLKSELNFPSGPKYQLDGSPYRWNLPVELMKPLIAFQNDYQYFIHINGRVPGESESVPIRNTAHFTDEMISQYTALYAVILTGINKQFIQMIPHFQLLNTEYYHAEIQPVLSHFALEWVTKNIPLPPSQLLASSSLPLSDHIYAYFTVNPSRYTPEMIDILQYYEKPIPIFIQLLNLSRGWLDTFLPHCLSKVNRVHYGILSMQHVSAILKRDPYTPHSRLCLAQPFIARDIPSPSSEHSSPEVVIGFTFLSANYQGLRYVDFTKIISHLKQTLEIEIGEEKVRPTYLKYAQWIVGAGGGDVSNFVSLRLLKLNNHKQMDALYNLWKHHIPVIEYYLFTFVYPEFMKFQKSKITASGVDIGGHILFNTCIGFSGTPSDLLPIELGQCEFEPGTPAAILHTLTNTDICSTHMLPKSWTVQSLLKYIATAREGDELLDHTALSAPNLQANLSSRQSSLGRQPSLPFQHSQTSTHALHPHRSKQPPKFRALIDGGAMITGLTNLQVAKFLLTLPDGLDWAQGVVYFDEEDQQKILLRNGQSIPLQQSGIPLSKRFVMYDHAHTIGTDVQHLPLACAAITIPKSIDDFSQAAYRMRGINSGQRITVMVTPEIASLINRTLLPIQSSVLGPFCQKFGLSQAALTSSESKCQQKQTLLRLIAFLYINTMSIETTQYIQLSQQNIANIWRSVAYSKLLDKASLMTSGRLADMFGKFQSVSSLQDKGKKAQEKEDDKSDDKKKSDGKDDSDNEDTPPSQSGPAAGTALLSGLETQKYASFRRSYKAAVARITATIAQLEQGGKNTTKERTKLRQTLRHLTEQHQKMMARVKLAEKNRKEHLRHTQIYSNMRTIYTMLFQAQLLNMTNVIEAKDHDQSRDALASSSSSSQVGSNDNRGAQSHSSEFPLSTSTQQTTLSTAEFKRLANKNIPLTFQRLQHFFFSNQYSTERLLGWNINLSGSAKQKGNAGVSSVSDLGSSTIGFTLYTSGGNVITSKEIMQNMYVTRTQQTAVTKKDQQDGKQEDESEQDEEKQRMIREDGMTLIDTTQLLDIFSQPLSTELSKELTFTYVTEGALGKDGSIGSAPPAKADKDAKKIIIPTSKSLSKIIEDDIHSHATLLSTQQLQQCHAIRLKLMNIASSKASQSAQKTPDQAQNATQDDDDDHDDNDNDAAAGSELDLYAAPIQLATEMVQTHQMEVEKQISHEQQREVEIEKFIDNQYDTTTYPQVTWSFQSLFSAFNPSYASPDQSFLSLPSHLQSTLASHISPTSPSARDARSKDSLFDHYQFYHLQYASPTSAVASPADHTASRQLIEMPEHFTSPSIMLDSVTYPTYLLATQNYHYMTFLPQSSLPGSDPNEINSIPRCIRKLKNVHVFLEWTPDMANVPSFTQDIQSTTVPPHTLQFNNFNNDLFALLLKTISFVMKITAHTPLSTQVVPDHRTDNAHLTPDSIKTCTITQPQAEIVVNCFTQRRVSLNALFSTPTVTVLDFINHLDTAILLPGNLNRYFVVVSLLEAQTIRRIIHLYNSYPQNRPDGYDKIHLSLHSLTFDSLLAQTDHYEGDVGTTVAEVQPKQITHSSKPLQNSAQFHQTQITQFKQVFQLLRFFNNEYSFTLDDAAYIVHALDGNSIFKTKAQPQLEFTTTQLLSTFASNLSSRRRLPMRWNNMSVLQLFSVPTRIHFAFHASIANMLLYIIAFHVKHAIGTIQTLGDFFHACDYDSNGLLIPSELYAGFHHFGLTQYITPQAFMEWILTVVSLEDVYSVSSAANDESIAVKSTDNDDDDDDDHQDDQDDSQNLDSNANPTDPATKRTYHSPMNITYKDLCQLLGGEQKVDGVSAQTVLIEDITSSNDSYLSGDIEDQDQTLKFTPYMNATLNKILATKHLTHLTTKSYYNSQYTKQSIKDDISTNALSHLLSHLDGGVDMAEQQGNEIQVVDAKYQLPLYVESDGTIVYNFTHKLPPNVELVGNGKFIDVQSGDVNDNFFALDSFSGLIFTPLTQSHINTMLSDYHLNFHAQYGKSPDIKTASVDEIPEPTMTSDLAIASNASTDALTGPVISTSTQQCWENDDNYKHVPKMMKMATSDDNGYRTILSIEFCLPPHSTPICTEDSMNVASSNSRLSSLLMIHRAQSDQVKFVQRDILAGIKTWLGQYLQQQMNALSGKSEIKHVDDDDDDVVDLDEIDCDADLGLTSAQLHLKQKLQDVLKAMMNNKSTLDELVFEQYRFIVSSLSSLNDSAALSSFESQHNNNNSTEYNNANIHDDLIVDTIATSLSTISPDHQSFHILSPLAKLPQRIVRNLFFLKHSEYNLAQIERTMSTERELYGYDKVYEYFTNLVSPGETPPAESSTANALRFSYQQTLKDFLKVLPKPANIADPAQNGGIQNVHLSFCPPQFSTTRTVLSPYVPSKVSKLGDLPIVPYGIAASTGGLHYSDKNYESAASFFKQGGGAVVDDDADDDNDDDDKDNDEDDQGDNNDDQDNNDNDDSKTEDSSCADDEHSSAKCDKTVEQSDKSEANQDDTESSTTTPSTPETNPSDPDLAPGSAPGVASTPNQHQNKFLVLSLIFQPALDQWSSEDHKVFLNSQEIIHSGSCFDYRNKPWVFGSDGSFLNSFGEIYLRKVVFFGLSHPNLAHDMATAYNSYDESRVKNHGPQQFARFKCLKSLHTKSD